MQLIFYSLLNVNFQVQTPIELFNVESIIY